MFRMATARRCCPAECLFLLPLAGTSPKPANFYSRPGGDRPRKKFAGCLQHQMIVYHVCWQAICRYSNIRKHSNFMIVTLMLILLSPIPIMERTELELSEGKDLLLPQVFVFLRRQIFPGSCPNRPDGIQVATVRRKTSLLQAFSAVSI